jgi:predicted PurR-regulated permease PerM
VGLSELAMFFALLGGVTVFGGLGVVLGPVAFATVAAIVDTLREPPRRLHRLVDGKRCGTRPTSR